MLRTTKQYLMRYTMRMTKAFSTAMIIVAFSLSAGLAHAKKVSTRGPISFTAYDADGNGTISEQEFNTTREQRQTAVKESGRMGQGMAGAPSFADVDTDKDEQISAQELQTMQQQQQENRGMGRGQAKRQ